MRQKLLFVCLMLLAIAGVSQAQEAKPGGPVQRLYPTPDTAEVVIGDDGGLVLVVTGGLSDGCIEMTVVTEQVGAAWFVDIYRELPVDAMCPQVMSTYEQRIDASALLELDADAQLVSVIIINGKIYGIDRTQIEDTPGAQAPAPLLNEYWVRSDLDIQTVTLNQRDDDSADITISIHQTDGCALPITRLYGVWDQEGQMMLDAYNIIPINASCLAIDETSEIAVGSGMFYALSVNGFNVPHNTVTTDTAGSYPFAIQTMGVETANVGWVKMVADSDPTIIINVTGITDGCDFPIQIVLGMHVDNTYTVKVARVLPADTACTMIAREFTVEQTFSLKLTGDAPLTFIIGDKTIVLGAE